MKRSKISIGALILFIIFGGAYALITNLFFDKLVSVIWTPLAIALYFLVFTVLLGALVLFFVKDQKYSDLSGRTVKSIAILLVAIFLLSMLFELIYELGMDTKQAMPDSYIFMIDDSGSMTDSDPQNQRAVAIDNLLKDKSDDFNYAVYVFTGDVQQVRAMLPKSEPMADMALASSGGTAIYGCLQKTLDDVLSGNLQIGNATRVILLSDGYSSDIPLFKSKLLKQYVEKGMVISTIGLGSSVDNAAMKQIALYTGGVYVHINDVDKLDAAMLEASTATAERNLLGYRGYCRTDALHAVMRIVFMAVIIALIFGIKLYAYGKYYKPNVLVSAIACSVAAVFSELGHQLASLGEGLVRFNVCVLISITLIQIIDVVRYKKDVFIDEEDVADEPASHELPSGVGLENNISDN